MHMPSDLTQDVWMPLFLSQCHPVHPAQEVLINVAPKKANWDLKRDVEGKLEKLERRTQRALHQIAQEEQRKMLEEEGVQD